MRILTLVALLAFSPSLFQLTKQQVDKSRLPELHKIKSVTLSPSYSCRPEEEFRRGYESTGLYLTPNSTHADVPDVLFNGACRAKDNFNVSLAGDDWSLIADLGANVTLEDVSASRAFNLNRIANAADYSKFVQATDVELNHTYAVVLNRRWERGLFLFTVVNHVPNKKVELRYVVKSYQVMDPAADSPGFDWEKKSQ
jgi:hypothetical protein